MKALEPVARHCIVCRCEGARDRKLPSGVLALVCGECMSSDFRVAEAERRAAAGGAA